MTKRISLSAVAVVSVLAFLGAALGTAAPAAATDAESLLGVWATAPGPKGQAHVEFTKTGGKYFGKLIWLEIPVYPADDEMGMAGQTKIDRKNPKKSLRTRPLIGMPIASGFDYAGGGRWEGGTIYDPENGKTYKCKISLKDDGTLGVRGYIGFSLLGRTSVWTPVSEDQMKAE